MKPNPLKDGALTENSAGIGTVTRKMVRQRAVELAVMDDRSAQEVSKSDWQQAKRELTGKPDMDPKEAMLESAPESERWDPVPGSAGHKVSAAPSEDEDEEGRSDNERLVNEGIAGAELDQMEQATRAAAKQDKEGN
jgi:hypothetical protein